MSNLPNGTFIVGNKLMGVCSWCDSIVRIDKPIFGSLHICLTEEEKQKKTTAKNMRQTQINTKDFLNVIGKGLAK